MVFVLPSLPSTKSLESSLSRKSIAIEGVAATRVVDLPPSSPYLFFCLVLLVCIGRFYMGSMAIEDTPQAIKSILDEEDMARI